MEMLELVEQELSFLFILHLHVVIYQIHGMTGYIDEEGARCYDRNPIFQCLHSVCFSRDVIIDAKRFESLPYGGIILIRSKGMEPVDLVGIEDALRRVVDQAQRIYVGRGFLLFVLELLFEVF